jgi:Trk-type K+ transport system membrane component
LHYVYFISLCLASALVFWGSATPFRSIAFTDCLFLTISAMTGAGLNPVNLSELNTFQQVILFLLIMLGSAILISAFVVQVRLQAFLRKFVDVKEKEKRRRNRGRVRTWASNSLKGKTGERLGDEEAGSKGGPNEDVYTMSDPESNKGSAERDETPPGRHGGPEMNNISSETGERLDDDSNTLSPISPVQSRAQGITFRDDTRFTPSRSVATGLSQTTQPLRRQPGGLFSMSGVGAQPWVSVRTNTSLDLSSYPFLQREPTSADPVTKARRDISKYLDNAQGWIARNSQFYGLTEEEREKLGGVEYRAVSTLAWLVPAYFVLFQLLSAIGLGAYIALHRPELAHSYGVNPWWAGAFNAVSAFNNSGMSLIDANAIPFARNYYPILTMGVLVLAGNTCYPIFLRIIVWALHRISERIARQRTLDDPWRERTKTLRFLLDHPRRCYTTLFPSQHTWWLALTVFSLNATDWIFFELLNIGNKAIFDGLATRYIVIDSLFQTLAVRGGGFYIFSLVSLRISLLVLYTVMMYISVYPVVITMRNSNVYEERSLGIYAEEDDPAQREKEEKEADADNNNLKPGLIRRATGAIQNNFTAAGGGAKSNENNHNFVRQQIRAQLAHDIWWVVLGIFLIMIIEANHFEADPKVFSVFNYIFEIVSAYSCVGMSLGVPWAAYSFSGTWYTLSKLILCAVMLRGRHRGLPVAIDKAVLLPGEATAQAEEEDGKIRLAKTLTRARLFNEV